VLGQTLGSYTLERELGRGGMGAVYTAVHTLLGRRAAVKVLLPELSRNQEIVQRFFNEARAATAIKHPSIVEIYDFGWASDGSAFIVMELMEGESLAARMRRLGRLPAATATTIARQVANALAAAHKAGIVHRDLKPDNVFLVPDIEVATGERVKLLDFGIAKLAQAGGVSHTSTGAVMGTPLYMSPEQCEGARLVDHRSDLYSLGCMLFEMISGRVPFVSEGVGGLIGMHLYVAPPTLRSLVPDAPAEVEAIVARLLAKPPGERFQSADELAAALGRTSGIVVAATPMPPHGMQGIAPAEQATVSPLAMGTPMVAHPPTTLSAAAGSSPSMPPTRVRSSRTGLWLGLVGVVAVGGVVAAIVAGGGGGQAAPAPVAAIDAAPAPVDAAPQVAAIDAAESVNDLRHDEAVAALATMKAAFKNRDWLVVRESLDGVYDSTFDGDPLRAQADEVIATARPLAIADAKDAIAKLVKKGDCAAAKQRAKQVVERWGDEAAPLEKLAAACKASTGKGVAGGGDPAPPPPGPAPEPVPGGSFEELLAEAQQAAKNAQWGRALAMGERALKLQPNDQAALMTSALAACNLKHASVANRYFRKLAPSRQALIRQRCLANGIKVGDDLPGAVY